MNSDTYEFLIEGFVAIDEFTVIGSCGDLPIYIGDTFDALYRYKWRDSLYEMGCDPVREQEIPVAVRVVGIHAYERCLKVLGQGTTGSLTIEGDGIDQISAGWVLGRRSVPETIGELTATPAFANESKE